MSILTEAKDNLNLSIVVPIFNEEESIGILYNRIKETLKNYHYKEDKYEIIFIDDGSTDASFQILEHLAGRDRCARVFNFKSNIGQHKAIEKGFNEARGEIIVTMDADLQNDAEDIPRLIAKLNEGFDIVCGWRLHRKDPLSKILKSKIGNFIQRKITGIKLHDMGCSMRAYKKDIVKDLVLQDRYEIVLLPYVFSKFTKRITEVEIKHNKRFFGKSKYDLLAMGFGVVRCYIKLIRTKRKIQCGIRDY